MSRFLFSCWMTMSIVKSVDKKMNRIEYQFSTKHTTRLNAPGCVTVSQQQEPVCQVSRN